MIAIPVKDTNTLARGPYWAGLIGIHLVLAGLDASVSDIAPEFYLLLSLSGIAALVWITYLRVKDIGWHGAHALWCFIPLGNIVLGFFKTGYAYRNLELEK